MITPPALSKGSKIAFVAPARKIERSTIVAAVKWCTSQGFVPVYNETIFAEDNQYAGSDDLRAENLQYYINRNDIAAIVMARGGYGCLRIVDKINFSPLLTNPKWIIGYSDVTVFHAKLQSMGIASLHASMPVNFFENTAEALVSLNYALTNKPLKLEFEANALNRPGKAEAEIVGGNLSVLYSMIGSNSFPETLGKILFLEDLDEYLYHIDRMMLSLKRAGKLANLAGIIVGGMTQMHDNTIPFGKNAQEIISEHVSEYSYPICFDAPMGHFPDNRALIFGKKTVLNIKSDNVSIEQ